MSNELSKASAGTASWPLASILTIVFLVLKLTHTIDWSWWWIVSPLWISAAFTVFILLLVAVIFTLVFIKKDRGINNR